MTSKLQRTLTIGLIIIGILVVVFFGLRTFHAFRQFRGHRPPPFAPAQAQPAQTDVELIRDWMTIPFIQHTYHIPPEVLFKELGIPPKGNEEKSLAQLNKKYFPNEDGIVLEKVKAAVRANQPPPTPTPPSASTQQP